MTTTGGASTAKQLVLQMWEEMGPTYGSVGTMLAQMSERLVQLAELSPGMHALDLGCGTGLVLRRAADAVGPHGSVVGVDFASAMVNETARVIANSELSDCHVVRMDATRLSFDDGAFDVCLAGSLIQFVLYSRHALAEWRRVLRPGGGLALSTPLPAESDSLAVFNQAALKVLPEPFRIAGAAGLPSVPDLEALSLGAGFSAATQTDHEFIDVLPDFETWWSFQWTHGSRGLLTRLEQHRLAQLKEELFIAVGRPSGEVPLQASMRFCVATC